MTLDVHAEDVAGFRFGNIRSGAVLHAAGLAATPRLDLRLDHDRAAQFLSGSPRLIGRRHDDLLGHGYVVPAEQLLCLPLEQVHASSKLATNVSP